MTIEEKQRMYASVRAHMIEFLLKTDVLDGLTVSVVKQIADQSANLAYEAASK